MREIKTNKIIAVIFSLIGLFSLSMSITFPGSSKNWPTLFSIILILLAVGLYVHAIRHSKKTDTSNEEKPTLSEFIVFFIIVIAVFIFILLLQKVGFIVLSIPLIGGLMWYTGYRKISNIIYISIGTTVLITIIFQILLKVPVPQGILQNLF